MTDRSYLERGTYEWPNDNWGWIAAALVGLFMLGGAAVQSYGDHSRTASFLEDPTPRTASFLEDATTGQSTRPPASSVTPALPAPRP
jgi:hypothetical protein